MNFLKRLILPIFLTLFLAVGGAFLLASEVLACDCGVCGGPLSPYCCSCGGEPENGDGEDPLPTPGGGWEGNAVFTFTDNFPFSAANRFQPTTGDSFGGAMTVGYVTRTNWHDYDSEHTDCCEGWGVRIRNITDFSEVGTSGGSGECYTCLGVVRWAPIKGPIGMAISTLFTLPGKTSDKISLKLGGNEVDIDTYFSRKPEEAYNSSHTVFSGVPSGSEYEFTWEFWTNFSGDNIEVKALNSTYHALQHSTEAELYSWNGSNWVPESISIIFGNAENEDKDCLLTFSVNAFQGYKLVLRDRAPSSNLLAFLLLSEKIDMQQGKRVSYIPLKDQLNMITGSVNLTEVENPAAVPPSTPISKSVQWTTFCSKSGEDQVEAAKSASSTFYCLNSGGGFSLDSGTYNVNLEVPLGYSLAGFSINGDFFPGSFAETEIGENNVVFKESIVLQEYFESIGNVYKTQKEGLIPLYKKGSLGAYTARACYKKDDQEYDYLYSPEGPYSLTTTDIDEKNAPIIYPDQGCDCNERCTSLDRGSYSNPEIIGYIKPPVQQMVPLERYRCFVGEPGSEKTGTAPNICKHYTYFVINGNFEIKNYINETWQGRCVSEGIIGYGYSTAGEGRTALKLMKKPRSSGSIYYEVYTNTTDLTELSSSWYSLATIAYIDIGQQGDNIPLYRKGGYRGYNNHFVYGDSYRYDYWRWMKSWEKLTTTDINEKNATANCPERGGSWTGFESRSFANPELLGYVDQERTIVGVDANDIPLYRYDCKVLPHSPEPHSYFVSNKNSVEQLGSLGICDQTKNCQKDGTGDGVIGYAAKRITEETEPLYLSSSYLGGGCHRDVYNSTYKTSRTVNTEENENKIASVLKNIDFYLTQSKGTISGNVYRDDNADAKTCDSGDLQQNPLADNWTVKCQGGSIEGGLVDAKKEGNKYTCCAKWLTANKALGKPATADSIYRPENSAQKAVDGNITDDFSRWVSADSPPVQISIWAQGTSAQGIGPRMTLYVKEGDQFESKAVWQSVSSYKEYTHTLESGVNPSQVRIGFDNDYWNPPNEDRNLIVDKIVVGGTTYQTEDPSVYVGVWSSATGCDPGYKQSEWLYCNGYFQYPVQISTTEDLPHWLEVDFGKEEEISRIKFWIGYQGYNNPISSYKIQRWDGSNWQDIISRQSAEGFSIVDESFAPVETNKIRFWSNSGERVRMYEFEAYGKTDVCQNTELPYGKYNLSFGTLEDFQKKKACYGDEEFLTGVLAGEFTLKDETDGSGPDFYVGVSVKDAWWQVEGGDIHADNGSIISNIPLTDPLEYLMLNKASPPTARHGIVSLIKDGSLNTGEGGIAETGSWRAESGKYEGKKYDYRFWKKKLSGGFKGEWEGDPNEDGLFEESDGLTINDSLDVSAKIFILVEGNVKINENIIVQPNKSFVIVASGNITIGGNVENLHGFYIANGIISTGSSDKKLTVEGGLIGYTNVNLQRDFGDSRNNTQPAEKFIFRQDIYLNLPEIKIREINQWLEVAP